LYKTFIDLSTIAKKPDAVQLTGSNFVKKIPELITAAL